MSIFVAVGGVMRSDRLYPEDLLKLPTGIGAIIPGHRVVVEHRTGTQIGVRKGRYEIRIEGPVLSGGWSFRSSELEALGLRAVCPARGS